MKEESVIQWHKLFREGRELIEDKPGHPLNQLPKKI